MRPWSSSGTPASHTPIASVRPTWADWHVAHVPIVELCDLHWDAMPGRRREEIVLCGFTSCDAVVAGELPHTGDRGHPHNVRVCILPEDNDRQIFGRLVQEAGPKPRPTVAA